MLSIEILSESPIGLILLINRKKYNYASSPDINRQFKYLLKHNKGKALSFLRKNAELLKKDYDPNFSIKLPENQMKTIKVKESFRLPKTNIIIEKGDLIKIFNENLSLGSKVPSVITVKGVGNVDFEVRYIPKGSRYGVNNSLIAKECLVEFYDSRTQQFISSYHADTIMDSEGSSGLSFDLSNPSWAIPQKSLEEVIDWIGDIEVYGLI